MNKKGQLEDFVDILGAVLILFIVGLLVSIPFKLSAYEEKQHVEDSISRIKATQALTGFLNTEYNGETTTELIQENTDITQAKLKLRAEDYFGKMYPEDKGWMLRIDYPDKKTFTIDQSNKVKTTLSKTYLPYRDGEIISLTLLGVSTELEERIQEGRNEAITDGFSNS